MRVGIDITSLMYGRGVSRYTGNLVRALAQLPDTQLSLLGYSWRQRAELERQALALLPKGSHHQVVVQTRPPQLKEKLWRYGLEPVNKVLPGIQVFHSWDWLQPPDKKLPLVSTIHDLAILKFPETAHPDVVKHHHRAWDILKERKARLIAVSHATKKDVVELLQYPANLVHVVYEALPLEFKKVSDAITEDEYERQKQLMQLSRPYLLFVGTREPRKNLVRLIKAWEPLAKECDLIIVGESGWDETSKWQGKYPGLRFLGKMDDRALAVLYGEAAALVYPCLYEGFGLPILEAFYHGTPVVTSNRSSMIEVAGNAAELVDPESVESIREGIKCLFDESAAAQQQRLQRMIIRLQLFDWQQVARETRSVYQKAIQDHG